MHSSYETGSISCAPHKEGMRCRQRFGRAIHFPVNSRPKEFFSPGSPRATPLEETWMIASENQSLV
jgi:hypothetical protein